MQSAAAPSIDPKQTNPNFCQAWGAMGSRGSLGVAAPGRPGTWHDLAYSTWNMGRQQLQVSARGRGSPTVG